MPLSVSMVIAFVWLLLWRARRKRLGSHLNSSIGAGAVRDLSGRGGF